LETAGQNLVAHASGDRSGIGAVISRLFGRGIQITAKVFSEGGRVATTKNGVRRDAEKAAYRECKRAEASGTPYQGDGRHVPDAAWMGQGQPYGWQDMSKRVNSSRSGQIGNYPVGYKSTHF
jgi:hypothetical protein